MTEKHTKQYADPVYAAAAVGDMAVDQIKKLPETATKLRSRMETEFGELQVRIQKIDMAEVRGRVRTELDSFTGKMKTEVSQLRDRAAEVRSKRVAEVRSDLDRVRDTAQGTASDFAGAARRQFQTATQQAVDVYGGLVSHGEKVLGEWKPGGPAVESPGKSAPARTSTAARTSTPARASGQVRGSGSTRTSAPKAKATKVTRKSVK